MGRLHSCVVAIGTLGALAAGAGAQELVVNGDMGTFGGPPANDPAVPNGWYVTTPAITSSQSAANSPFTNRYPNNGSAWNLADDAASGIDGFRQDYSPTVLPAVAVNFDFRLDALTNNPWGVQFDQANVASAVHFRIDTGEGGVNNQFAINQTNAAAGYVNVLTLTAGQWYNVRATFDDAAGTISGSITPDGSAAVPFAATLLPGHAGFNSVLIRDRTAAQSGGLTFDNFSVVPEPASLGLLALGGVGLLARRRRGGA